MKHRNNFAALKKTFQSVGDFIRLYATRNKRWTSPKFLAGESYGTTRAAGLSGYLQNRLRIVPEWNCPDFHDSEFPNGGIRPRQRFALHTLSSHLHSDCTWYHKKLSSDLQSDLQKALESRTFTAGEYTDALMAGDNLPAETRKEIAQKLSRLTGLPAEYVSEANLRIEIMRFDKELLRSERRTVGRLDGRFKGIDHDAAGAEPDYDPSLAAIVGPYTATFNDYVRGDLKFESDLPYEFLMGRVRPWNYQPYENRYVQCGRDASQRHD